MRFLIPDVRFLFFRVWPRSSARIEQQPSKLWVAGSNPAGVASKLIGRFGNSRPVDERTPHLVTIAIANRDSRAKRRSRSFFAGLRDRSEIFHSAQGSVP